MQNTNFLRKAYFWLQNELFLPRILMSPAEYQVIGRVSVSLDIGQESPEFGQIQCRIPIFANDVFLLAECVVSRQNTYSVDHNIGFQKNSLWSIWGNVQGQGKGLKNTIFWSK